MLGLRDDDDEADAFPVQFDMPCLRGIEGREEALACSLGIETADPFEARLHGQNPKLRERLGVLPFGGDQPNPTAHRMPSLGREMADGLDIVPVRIDDEGTVVVRVVLGPNPRLVEHLGPTCDGGIEEGLNRGSVGGAEGDVRFAEAVAGLLRADPEVGHRWNAVSDGRTAIFHDPCATDRGEHRVVERRADRHVATLNRWMIEHWPSVPAHHPSSPTDVDAASLRFDLTEDHPTVRFTNSDFDGHEQVIHCHDERVGLQAIIAIHSTALGPAAGGCRMHPYPTADDALTDVLRLSKGMSYKNAMADLPLGGGKCVIIADPARPDKAELLRAFSHHVQALGGRYWTAIDVGVGPADADVLAENCEYIFANAARYPEGFDPSTYTALGGFTSIEATVRHVWGRNDLGGLRVAIQGLGATGGALAGHLHRAGAELVVADVRREAVAEVVERFNATAVDPADIHRQDVDVFAPCAFGAVISDQTLPELRAKVVCGLANNQLAEPRHDRALRDAGIVYVPDYVVNGGGMIGAGAAIYSEPTDQQIGERINAMADTVRKILTRADAQDRPTAEVTDEIAGERIAAAR